IAAVAHEDRFHEAVIWENRHASETALAELIAKPAAAASRTSRRRQHEELVSSYLHRYCVKNDTIGFFGPVAYARLTDRDEPVTAYYGAEMLRQRTVYFEVWCIDMLGQALAANPAVRPWLAPRLRSGFHLEGAKLRRPYGQLIDLPREQ